ncbi:MAG: type II secretion system F family protein [Candidatus Omnitrophota bacterium]
MITWDVVLISLAAGCFSWAVMIFLGEFLENRKSRTRLFDPVSNEEVHLPYTLDEKQWRKENVEDIEKDHLKKQLIEAGIFRKSIYGFFKLAFRFAIFLPLAIIAMALLTNKFNADTLMLSLFAGAFFYFLLRWSISKMRQKRKQAILRALPDQLDLLIICIESGLNFMASLAWTLKESDKNSPLSKELDLLYHEYLGGLPLSSACTRMAQRCDMPEVTSILSTITQSEKLGLGLGQTLRVQAAEFRDKYRQRIREKAFKIPVKLVFPIVLILTGAMMPISCGPAFYRLMNALKFTVEKEQPSMDKKTYEIRTITPVKNTKR